MADITNRSPYVVTVARRPNLQRTFAFSKSGDAQTYINNLRQQGLTPELAQGDTSWLVRVRRVGHKDQSKTFKSFDEAKAFAATIEAEQHRGLFRDYAKGAQTTTAALISAYIAEDCPGLKGGDNYAIILNAMLADGKGELRERIEQRKREIKEFGKAMTPLGANREAMTSLEWLYLPLTEVKPDHVEAFIRDRLEFVAPATVTRQIQLLSAVYNRQLSKQRIFLDNMPLDGVRRPKFFNERDRRLVGNEEERLLQAARNEDKILSFAARVAELAEMDVKKAVAQETHYAINRDRKAAYERARARAIEEGFPHIPMMEAFIVFQLGTAARRSEALGLVWDWVDFEKQKACLPDSKNSRPRKLALRTDVMDFLHQLPRTSDLVFDIPLKTLLKAWRRICTEAGAEDLHIHDLRHEGISRLAESGLFRTVLDLQAFSGHRDLRSLSRYTHLCTTSIALLADEAESLRKSKQGFAEHNGRVRLRSTQLNFVDQSPQMEDTTPPSNVATSSSNVLQLSAFRTKQQH